MEAGIDGARLAVLQHVFQQVLLDQIADNPGGRHLFLAFDDSNHLAGECAEDRYGKAMRGQPLPLIASR